MSPNEAPSTKHWILRPLLLIGGSVVVTLIAFALAVGFAGAGHGSYLPAALLFPIPILTAFLSRHISKLAGCLAVAQWPAYAALMHLGDRRGHLKTTAAIIALVHLGSVVLVAMVFGDQF